MLEYRPSSTSKVVRATEDFSSDSDDEILEQLNEIADRERENRALIEKIEQIRMAISSEQQKSELLNRDIRENAEEITALESKIQNLDKQKLPPSD